MLFRKLRFRRKRCVAKTAGYDFPAQKVEQAVCQIAAKLLSERQKPSPPCRFLHRSATGMPGSCNRRVRTMLDMSVRYYK